MVDFGKLRIAFYFDVTSKVGAHDPAQRSGRAQKFLGINPNTAMPLKSRPGRNRRRLRAGCCWPRACQAVTPSNNYPGLRLGLRIALQIAQAHGGTLELTSTLKETGLFFGCGPGAT
jgi:hypothetical protein